MTTTQKTYLHIIHELENQDVELVMRSLYSVKLRLLFRDIQHRFTLMKGDEVADLETRDRAHFQEKTRTNKALRMTMVTAFGLDKHS
jgi:uncharacterized membrane protein